LDDVFDSRRNSLNALRLVLASLVIFRHAVVVVDGTTESSLWLDQLFGQLPVDGFFALSGFLIARSWAGRPDSGAFLAARVGRIFPGFWVCLAVTAFVIRPFAGVVGGEDAPSAWRVLVEGVQYVAVNSSLVIFQHDIGGSPQNVPWPHDWNGSLWTLKWEFICYLGVMCLGLLGWLTKRHVVVALLALVWCGAFVVATTSLETNHSVDAMARFALMYMSGVGLFVLRRSVPVTPVAVAAALGGAIMAGAVVPDYQLVAALPLAFGLVGIGALVRVRRLQFHNDISYGMYIYGFPIQQLLAGVPEVRGLGPLPSALIALVITAPVAWASWVLVERPSAKRIKAWSRGVRTQAPSHAGSE
jgi:peptidoglycan/LPS O-acetylase OafA/YrhL